VWPLERFDQQNVYSVACSCNGILKIMAILIYIVVDSIYVAVMILECGVIAFNFLISAKIFAGSTSK
jgi:hypothetical protein